MSRNFILQKVFHNILTAFYHYLYHSFAWSYDLIAWMVSFGEWQKWTESIIPLINGNLILETGHGPGHLLHKLKSMRYQVIGIDESWQMVKKAYRKLVKNDIEPTILRGVAQYLPFPNKTFDTILSIFPTSYVLDPKTIRETYRVLRENGRWVVLMGINIISKSIPYKILSFLYNITGESINNIFNKETVTAPFRDTFLDKVEIKWIPADKISLLVIICQKGKD